MASQSRFKLFYLDLIVIIPTVISICLNILSMMGIVDIKFANWGNKITVNSLFLFILVTTIFHKKILVLRQKESEHITAKLTIQQLVVFCSIIFWLLTMFFSLMIGYN